MKQFIA